MSQKIKNEEPEQKYLNPEDCCVPVKNSAIAILENMEINKALDNLIRKISDQYKDFLSVYNIKEEIEEVKRKVLALEINDQTIIDYYFNLSGFSGAIKREDHIEMALYTSLIYVSMAQITSEDDRPSMAWRAISKAEYNLGLSTGLINYSALAKSERSEKGNQQRHQNKLYIKKVILDTMIKHRPIKGWSTVVRAVDGIIETMEKIIKNENLKLPKNKDYLVDVLRNIISDDDELLEAMHEKI